jgi:hypothetical protein
MMKARLINSNRAAIDRIYEVDGVSDSCLGWDEWLNMGLPLALNPLRQPIHEGPRVVHDLASQRAFTFIGLAAILKSG